MLAVAKPGLVCTVFNWARPRDMSHYETFEHYHATFYKHVEALSVTPFSPGALQRGLAGLLVSLVRLTRHRVQCQRLCSPVPGRSSLCLRRHRGDLPAGQSLVGDGPEVADFVRAELQSKVDLWKAEAQNTTGGRIWPTIRHEVQEPGGKRERRSNLCIRPGLERWEAFTCLNSLREVEPTVKLIMDDGGLDDVTDEVPVAPEANVVDGEDDGMGEEMKNDDRHDEKIRSR